MTLRKEEHCIERDIAWGYKEPMGHSLYGTLILDILFYAREITSIQNKRSPKTATMCIILINTHFTAAL